MGWNILILVYAVLSVYFSYYYFKERPTFSIVTVLLFLYSVFSMIGYINYPKKLNVVSGGQYYGEKVFLYYYLYLLVFVIFVFIFYRFFNGIRRKYSANVITINVVGGKAVLYVFLISFCVFLFYEMIKNISISSYSNQLVLKSNKVWFFLYEFSGVIILMLSNILYKNRVELKKNNGLFIVLTVAFAIVFIATSLLFGQRKEIFMLIVGMITMLINYLKVSNQHKRISMKKVILLTVPLLIVAVFLFQLIRNSRGLGISEYQLNAGELLLTTFKSMFDMEFLVFQDWLSPSLSLITCIYYHNIDPLIILKADFLNLFSFLTHYSVDPTTPIRDLFNLHSTTGYGYYFPTEGYELIGPFGCVLSAFLINLYYRVYDSIFDVKDVYLRSYLSGIVGFYIISIVRGYSLFFIKGIIFYIIPGIVLYNLATKCGFKIIKVKD